MSLEPQPDATSDTVSLQEAVTQLRELDEEMPEALHAQLLAAGTAVVPDLLAVLEDEQPEHGWAPLHAARLLDELGDVRAVPGLLRCLERCDKLML